MSKTAKVIRRYCFTEKEKQAIAQGKKIMFPPKPQWPNDKSTEIPLIIFTGTKLTVNAKEGWVEWEEEAE